MLYKEYGIENKPTIIFIHGGGVSAWMWDKQIEFLKNDYRIYTIILDGHGEDYKNSFKSIDDCAVKVTDFIKSKCGGKVFAICGFSIGAQITVEILSKEYEITDKAIIESAMVIPMGWLTNISKPLFKVTYPLVKNKYFSKLQAKSMNISDELFERYYNESCNLTLDTLSNMGFHNAKYSLPETFSNSKADILVLCGSKEISNMKRSAEFIVNSNKNSKLLIIEKAGHGISLQMPDKYIEIISEFFVK